MLLELCIRTSNCQTRKQCFPILCTSCCLHALTFLSKQFDERWEHFLEITAFSAISSQTLCDGNACLTLIVLDTVQRLANQIGLNVSFSLRYHQVNSFGSNLAVNLWFHHRPQQLFKLSAKACGNFSADLYLNQVTPGTTDLYGKSQTGPDFDESERGLGFTSATAQCFYYLF